MKFPKPVIKTINYKEKNKSAKIFSLVEYFRKIKGMKKEQMECLKGRLMKRAKTILVMCDYDLNKSKKIVLKANDYFNSEGLEWGLEAVIKNFHILDRKTYDDE